MQQYTHSKLPIRFCNYFTYSCNSYCRARQRCFWLLAFISRPQVRNIHLPGRMILPGSLIPSDKYFLKNLTFVVRISTRVATSPFQSPFHSSQSLVVCNSYSYSTRNSSKDHLLLPRFTYNQNSKVHKIQRRKTMEFTS